MKKYYLAYDERYKTIHKKGYSWSSDVNTPIVIETIEKYGIGTLEPMLEIGCGEGRDAIFLLKKGYDVLAADVSPEAISYCKKAFPTYADKFKVEDLLKNNDGRRYKFIYSVAVVHMLLADEDRKAFYKSVRDRLTDNGVALIVSMGDGSTETATNVNDAFVPVERDHFSGKVVVAGTSLKTISFSRFEREINENGLLLIEKGVTSAMPEFNLLMYAVVKRA
ncbi:MAG: class I SAM-dependent methyltransferase [Clostridia bacterium]|nr:class I SAM-dependent methyltransferase [Clostridia bacterium]